MVKHEVLSLMLVGKKRLLNLPSKIVSVIVDYPKFLGWRYSTENVFKCSVYLYN